MYSQNLSLRQLSLAVALALAAFVAAPARATVRLPHVFGSHMVLQQEKSLVVWGWADLGETISVEFGADKGQTKANDRGEWKITLSPPKLGAPATLVVKASNEIRFDDVLVGEVWLCSGQSNMEMGIGMVDDAEKEIAAANYPNIRLLMVPNLWKPEPQTDMDGAWKVCTPETIHESGWGGFSAAGYFFGRELHRKLNVPIGLIDATWGGTRIESWTPPEGFAAVPSLSGLSQAVELGDPHSEAHKERLKTFLGETEKWVASAHGAMANAALVPPMPTYPQELLPPHDLQNSTALFNGMIYPVHPFAIRGAIWYQGEANNGEGMVYAEKMKALIMGWRHVWGEGAFPFYFAQIAPYNYGDHGEHLAELWEGQAAAATQIPDVGMAVINDIGNLKDIHPKNKQEVGRRLALLALARTYRQTDIVYSGPTYQSMAAEGAALRVRFDHADELKSRDGQPLNWFEIIDADEGGFVKADAKIDGSSVVLTSPEVHHPVAVQFAWNQLAEPNLVNGAGLPTGAFRAGTVPKRDWVAMHVHEAQEYQLVYDLDLAKLGADIHWDVDNRAKIHGAFDRVAYCLELMDAAGNLQAAYVSMDAFTESLDKIGIPTHQSGAHFQQPVAHLHVFSNVKNVVTGTDISGGNIEFWPNNYGPQNSGKVPNASASAYDFGDEPSDPADGYGSMQVHNHDAKQTIFSVNHWREGDHADLGIGNAPTGNPDWTFSGNAGTYKVKRLRVFVHLK